MRRKSLWKQAVAVSLSVTMLLGLPAEVTFAEEGIAESSTEIVAETESAEHTEFATEEGTETEEDTEFVAEEIAETEVEETEAVVETEATEIIEEKEEGTETEEAAETVAIDTEAEETEAATEELEKEAEEESETVEVISEEKNATAASDFNYEVNEDGTITITGYTGNDADIEIPEEIDGKRVTEIGKSAFESCYNLISVKISNGVTSIGDSAFENCGNLTSIEIPNSVTSIGKEAFGWCTDLTSIRIPDSVTSIGEDAFLGCFELASVTIPSSVTSIERSAFAYCSRLTSIEVDVNNTVYTSEGSNCIIDKRDNTLIQGCNGTIIPNSVKGIGQEAFYGCDITDIVIPDSVTWIGIDAFCNCDELTNITIPNSVISIGYSAFWGCGSLIDITLPDSVTYIEPYAFERCSKLISVKIPSSVEYIGYGVFSYCTQLASIEVDASNPYYTSKGSNCIIEKSSNILIQGCNSTVILDGVTAIAQYAFSRCEGLTGITIPNSVTSIGQGAFAECSGLTSITIPNNVTSIGKYAFEKCSNLTRITIPNSVTSIEENVFKDCENVVIYCYANSYAQQYAIDNNISYQLLKTQSCTHAHTEIRNAKSATVTETGYTGDTYCKDCGKLISSGTTIAKLTASYTVKFDGNGANSGSMENQKITYASGKALSANKFKKKGYSFNGWNTKKDGSGTTYADKADGSKLTKTDGKTVTLYAQWTANKYTITFNGNGSTSGSTKKMSNCKYGKKYTLTKNSFKKKGYTFTGWNTKKDGSGKSYKNKAEVKNLTSKSGGKVTLYAQWKKTKYTITYNLNKGTNNKNNPSSYNITTKTIKLKNPTRKGYTFAGWYSDKKCTKKVTQIKKGSTGNITLYAKWKKK